MRKGKRNRVPFKKKREKWEKFTNDRIRANMIRVVGSEDFIKEGIYSKREALNAAIDNGLDLVQMSEQDDLAICRIMDYSKYCFEQKKKERRNKNKSPKNEIKEIQLGANISDHDFDVKKKKVIEFIEKGSKVKLSVKFKGRMIQHKDLGEIKLLKMAEALNEIAIVESYKDKSGETKLVNMTGRMMNMLLKPKK